MTSAGGAFTNPYMGPGARELSDKERAVIEERDSWWRDEGAYSHLQGTKPQTLSYGLNDSPAGLAAWIVDRFRTWSNNDDDLVRRRYYTRDELLTNITIYWVSETINSTCRFYYEVQHSILNFAQEDRIRVPCAIAILPED